MGKDQDKIPEEIRKLSFEEALKALEEIVTRLEAGDTSLDESIDAYTRGTQLKRHCEEKLKNAQAKIEKISLDEKGSVKGTAPFDED